MAQFFSTGGGQGQQVEDSELRFLEEEHVKYIQKVSKDTTSFEMLVTAHMRMSGVYWGTAAMALLGRDLGTEMDSNAIVEWIFSCQYENGGFGGNVGHDPHMLYTLSALQVLAICDELEKVDTEKVIEFVVSLQNEDGSFCGDQWGEIDTRFSYCALQIMSLLGALHSNRINLDKAVEYVAGCRNFDGGYGAVQGAESHAGQIFCCVGALSIAGDNMGIIII